MGGALVGAIEDQELMFDEEDSATTERTPSGLASRATVVRRWMKRIKRSRVGR